MVQQMGGTIEAENADDGGLRIIMKFPNTEVNAVAKRILIIEDDQAIAEIESRLFRAESI